MAAVQSDARVTITEFSDEWVSALRHLAEDTARLLMTFYGQAHLPQFKADKSPVTEADLAADRLIEKGLRALAPEIPIISEEGSLDLPKGAMRYWLVDPLDGTKSFVRGHGDFCVNIGLIENGFPVFGLQASPLNSMVYWGGRGLGAFRAGYSETPQAIRTRAVPPEGMTLYLSHMGAAPEADRLLQEQKIDRRIAIASATKFCYLAEGNGDCYPRFGPTSEWDTVSGQAIVEGSGGRMLGPDGERFRYGKPNWRNGNFVAWGR